MTLVVSKPGQQAMRSEIRAMKKVGAEIRKTRESARAFLRKHGFIDKKNNLAARYR